MNSRLLMPAHGHERLPVGLLVSLLLMSCQDDKPGMPDVSGSGQVTDFAVLISPERDVDILFMVDNSPGMDPKQEALAKAFPEMLASLKKLPNGLPDLRIGVVSSDVGAGAGEAAGNCMVLGNQGILWGNDPSVDPAEENNKYGTVKDLKNAAGASGCGMKSGARWIEDVLGADSISRAKNYQGDLSDVFSCLAKGVGVNGCGYEHQLQSLRVALLPQNGINPQNNGFIRRSAYLALVLVTDEDDCSANPEYDTNDGMFHRRTPGDTASLRCAARGHVCDGRAIPDYDPDTGYQGVGFSTDFANCEAKDVDRDDRTDNPSDFRELPLIRIRDMVDSVNQVKDRPSDQIIASGIIGWPQDGELAGVKYEIGKDPSSKPEEQRNLYDYLPICTFPDQQSADGNTYKAYGGLRLKKFLDAFAHEEQTNVFSICRPDNFSDALKDIGTAIGKRIDTGCVSFPLADSDRDLPGLQAECAVTLRSACEDPGEGKCTFSGYEDTSIPQCRDNQDRHLDVDDPRTDTVSEEVRPCWYLHHDTGAFGCTRFASGLRAVALLPGDAVPPPGSFLSMQCATCPDGQPGCQI